MSSNINDRYLEARVMSASPMELVHLLYEAAAQAVREARRHLAAGDIRSRSQQITRASALVAELGSSLDAARGGQIAARLAGLYDYMGTRLNDANLHQADEPLAEVLGLLGTLGEAWEQLAAASATPGAHAPVPSFAEPAVFGGYGAFTGDPYGSAASQSWSA